jgi:superoxide dismutase, Cu-Zn family
LRDAPAAEIDFGSIRFETDRFSVAALFDADGSAVIVHAGRDNFANILTRYHSHTEDVFGPDSATLATGDAGGRNAAASSGSHRTSAELRG